MHADFNKIAQSAVERGLAPENFVSLSIFPQYYEPEAKIDLGIDKSAFMNIRRILHHGQRLNTEVLPDTINAGSHAMNNIIVDAMPANSHEPLFASHGKFMRIAGRVNEDGKIYSIKIAMKCLSRNVEVIQGLPYRQEFEPTIPQEVQEQGLETCFNWFMNQYADHYKDNAFSNITYQDLKPTNAYNSARTGYYFLTNLEKHGIVLVNEACEDLYLPIAADLVTPLASFTDSEAQLEWETVGAISTTGNLFDMPPQEILTRIGLETMQRTSKHLIKKLYPKDEWKSFIVTDSKAEIARQRTLAHSDFIHDADQVLPFNQSNKGASLKSLALLMRNTKPLHEVINSTDVVEARIKFSRNMEQQRVNVNYASPKGLEVRPEILAA